MSVAMPAGRAVMLEVSRAAYYGWARQIPSARQSSDEALLAKIKDIHTASRGTYGSPRVHAQLRNDGQACGRKRVARLMRHNSIVGRCKRRFRRTTIADPDAATTAVDLVKRSFVGRCQRDRSAVVLRRYLHPHLGRLASILATVIDVASRRVVGWAMADHMRTELVCDALRMAIQHRRPAPGLILHSDRGSAIHLDRVRRSARRQRAYASPCPGRVSAGTTPSPRASSPPSKPSSFICTHGQPVPKPVTRYSSSWSSLLQPLEAAFSAWIPVPRELPTEARKTRRQDQGSGIVNVSVKPGQPHTPTRSSATVRYTQVVRYQQREVVQL